MTSQNKAVNLAPAVSSGRRVALTIEEGSAIVQLSKWVDGLGWCGEKTMRLDPELLDNMHLLIAAARIRLREQRNANDNFPDRPRKILDFPAL